MAKMYKKKTGLCIVSGRVTAKEAVQQGTKVSIEVEEFDSETKKWNKKTVDAISNTVDEDIAVGCIATAVGYQCGISAIMASTITTGAHVFDPEPDVEIITGVVNKASFKPEVQEDGTPKLKRDGSPRKPHFDVSIIVPDNDGHKVIHIIKTYNFKDSKGEKTEIEKAEAKFKDFQDRKSTPMAITVVTQPGMESNWESEYNGKVYQNFASSHLGKMSWDIMPLEATPVRENNQVETTPAQTAQPEQTPTQTQSAAQPTQTAAPQPEKVYGTASPTVKLEDDDPIFS